MPENVLKNTGWLVLLVLVVLLLMHHLPRLSVWGHVLRPVDLLADIRQPVPETAEEDDSVWLPVPEVKPEFVDTCRTGLTCIEDYSDSTFRGMVPFYRALSESAVRPRPVRIAYFGDSYIEADIFTADLREMLQKQYGGCGVGFVPVTSPIYGFRPTVRHAFDGWESHAASDTLHFDARLQGVSGHYFIPRRGAYVELRGQKSYASLLDTCRRVGVWFRSREALQLGIRLNGADTQWHTLPPADGLQCLTVANQPIGSVRCTVGAAGDSTLFYGLTMDGVSGISLDNFSLRGSSGLSLRRIPDEMLRQWNELRPYDLVVLHYGLNVATERGRNYDRYLRGMQETVQKLKRAFPGAGILVVGVGDREYRTEQGELRTMPGIKNLVRYQQSLAAGTHVAFWNLFEAMGGEGSMVRMAEAEPAEANLDYAHINFRGGKRLARLLYEAMEYGYRQYERKASMSDDNG